MAELIANEGIIGEDGNKKVDVCLNAGDGGIEKGMF
jgi:hypothetical protein